MGLIWGNRSTRANMEKSKDVNDDFANLKIIIRKMNFTT